MGGGVTLGSTCVICSTCGRDNAEHLTFCEDCGARLKARVAAPTPPVGLQPPDLTPTPAQPVPVTAPQPAPRPAPGLVGATGACPRCGAACTPGLRFCTSCGQPVVPTAPEVARPAPRPATGATASPATPAAGAPIAAGPIAAMPVVELGGRPRDPETRPCPRCRGFSLATAQFCRFCGTPLGNAAPQQPIPTPVAARPVAPMDVLERLGPPLEPPAAKQRLDTTLASGPPAHEPETAPASAPPPQTPRAAPPEADLEHTTQVAAFQGTCAPKGRLVLIARDGGAGPSYPILDQLDIGRTEGEVVMAEDRTLAARHARFTRRGSVLFVRDLGTVNGVYKRLRPGDAGAAHLRDQDLILVGQQVLRFEVVKPGEDGLGPAMQHGTLLFGTPVPPLYARLCQRTVAGLTQDVYHLHKAETVLGRESGDIVFTDDPFLSRRHASIRVAREGETVRATLADLESSNGTFLRTCGEVELQDGDELRIGQQLLRLDLSGSEFASTMASEPRGTG